MSSYYSIYPRTSTWQAIKQEQKYRQEAETLREEVESLKAGGHAAGNHVISWSCICLYTRPYILWIWLETYM